MFMDIFVLPRRGSALNEKKTIRLHESAKEIANIFYAAKDFRSVNNAFKQALFYSVFYDDEFLDPRLVSELRAALMYSASIDMFSLFIADGGADGRVVFQPRVFKKELLLDLDCAQQPLPREHARLRFEKLLGGWVYRD